MNLQNTIKKIIKEKRYKRLDLVVTVALVLLLIFSCIMVYSASMIGNKYGIFTNYKPVASNYFLLRQSMWAVLSLISYFIFSVVVPYEVFKNKKFYTLGFLVIAFLLVLALFSGSINGARSWVTLGPITFQPSVAAQIFIIAYMALILNARKETLMKPTSWQELLNIFMMPIILLGLIFIQNDTGTMLITGMAVILVFMCANISFRNIMSLIKLGVISSAMLILVLFIKGLFSGGGTSYQLNRIKVFLDPFYGTTDPNNQIVNSLIAFGNGGLFGRGIGNSIQKLGYLSEAHTDFILAVTAEELGFFGVLFLVTLITIIIVRVMYTGLKADTTFEALFPIGFGGLLAIQTIINIGGVTASIPMTGVPIPFFSNGGTSMLILSTTLGIVMNLLSHIKYKKGGK